MSDRHRKIKAGALIVLLKEGNRVGVLTRKSPKNDRFSTDSPYWEMIMQDTGKKHYVLEINLSNGFNRYKIV